MLYGDHPYARPQRDEDTGVTALTRRDDLIRGALRRSGRDRDLHWRGRYYARRRLA